MPSTRKKASARKKAPQRKPRQHAGGMPSKCTPEVIEKICEAVRAGAYLETAAAFAGIAKQTLHGWQRKGRRDLNPTSKKARPKPNTPEAKFVKELDKALAFGEMMDLATIGQFAKGFEVVRTTVVKHVNQAGDVLEEKTTTERRTVREWTAAAWRLERKYPSRWGRRLGVRGEVEREDGTMAGGGGFQLKVVKMPARDEVPSASKATADGGNGSQ